MRYLFGRLALGRRLSTKAAKLALQREVNIERMRPHARAFQAREMLHVGIPVPVQGLVGFRRRHDNHDLPVGTHQMTEQPGGGFRRHLVGRREKVAKDQQTPR